MLSSVEKAGVLVEALPYIRTFAGKTFVIKYGGHAMDNAELTRAVVLDVILLKYVGVHPVIVHGGGPEITAMLQKLGKESQFVGGLRVTDAETMEIVQMVLVGKINQQLVSLINRYGGRAVGLSGVDGNLIVARKHQLTPEEMAAVGGAPVDLGFVGDVEAINPAAVHLLSQAGYIPVISSVGAGLDGQAYNINADLVAGELAAALGAEKLIMLTDVEGIFEDPNDPATLISALQVERASRMIEERRIQGGMIPKVQACIRALSRGVSRAHIIDGRKLHSLLLEIFTDRGIGTMVIG
ncbi:MAG: acetylglutamate kinase [Limnochordales bacterium]|nr:acetylglutamate kinase [Limnochordales bacterium]